MTAPNSIPAEVVRQLKKAASAELGIEERYDSYFFLARLGSNYDKYVFNWEPFRDLAGPLVSSETSLPILVISDDKARSRPEIVRQESPYPHFRFFVSPSVPVAPIANTWLELLVSDGAQHEKYKGPFSWFTKNLGTTVEDLSERARQFLNL